MPIKKLFLSHYSQHSAEVEQLATELRIRGVVPWVDKDGGLRVGDDSAQEARRAIREDCFGLALYATGDAFERPFIRDVEIDEAKNVKQVAHDFLLFAIPRKISFQQLASSSMTSFGIDLSPYHTHSITDDADLQAQFSKVAADIVGRVLHKAKPRVQRALSLQFSTRELMPLDRADVLCLDAVALLSQNPGDEEAWRRVLQGLSDVKRIIAGRCGRPRLVVSGSKHLSAAFMFGRVFSPFNMDVRQTRSSYWSCDGPVPDEAVFSSSFEERLDGSSGLIVEVVGRHKNVSAGVDDYLRRSASGQPAGRLRLRPRGEPLDIDAASCRAMVTQTYEEIERAVARMSRHGQLPEEIHLFVAAPQSFMMLLGREFRGMPPVVLYEWTGVHYVRSCRVPSDIL